MIPRRMNSCLCIEGLAFRIKSEEYSTTNQPVVKEFPVQAARPRILNGQKRFRCVMLSFPDGVAMNLFLEILNIVLPVFIVIGLGTLLRRIGLIDTAFLHN